ncbi:MAG: hypothetical protein V4633_18375 [Pseudomonadota bacterium]
MKRACMLLLAAGLAAGASAQEVGRLFTTPAERAALERQRNGVLPASGASPAAPAPDVREPLAGEQIIEVNGTVRRSGKGRATTWIGSVPRSADGRLIDGVRLGPDSGRGLVTVTLRSGKVVLVKPGQRIDAVTGKVLEGYQSGILVTPGRKKAD